MKKTSYLSAVLFSMAMGALVVHAAPPEYIAQVEVVNDSIDVTVSNFPAPPTTQDVNVVTSVRVPIYIDKLFGSSATTVLVTAGPSREDKFEEVPIGKKVVVTEIFVYGRVADAGGGGQVAILISAVSEEGCLNRDSDNFEVARMGVNPLPKVETARRFSNGIVFEEGRTICTSFAGSDDTQHLWNMYGYMTDM